MVLQQLRCRLQSQPRFPGAAGSGQCQQLHLRPLQQGDYLTDFVLASQEERGLTRQIMGTSLQRPQRRKYIWQVRVKELCDALWFQQVAQSVFAMAANRCAIRQRAACKLLDGLGEQDLLAMAHGEQTSEAVQGGRQIVAPVIRLGLSSM